MRDRGSQRGVRERDSKGMSEVVRERGEERAGWSDREKDGVIEKRME